MVAATDEVDLSAVDSLEEVDLAFGSAFNFNGDSDVQVRIRRNQAPTTIYAPGMAPMNPPSGYPAAPPPYAAPTMKPPQSYPQGNNNPGYRPPAPGYPVPVSNPAPRYQDQQYQPAPQYNNDRPAAPSYAPGGSYAPRPDYSGGGQNGGTPYSNLYTPPPPSYEYPEQYTPSADYTYNQESDYTYNDDADAYDIYNLLGALDEPPQASGYGDYASESSIYQTSPPAVI
jgi:hypothetical protein